MMMMMMIYLVQCLVSVSLRMFRRIMSHHSTDNKQHHHNYQNHRANYQQILSFHRVRFFQGMKTSSRHVFLALCYSNGFHRLVEVFVACRAFPLHLREFYRILTHFKFSSTSSILLFCV